MSELETIQRSTEGPVTREQMGEELTQLGVQPGMVLLVHSSLSQLGWVSGGAPAVILALEDALGEQGTLVMPTHSGDLSDPRHWVNPPVPADWHEIIRATMPAFDTCLTPTRGMGVIAETFRKQRGVIRSQHPHFSFAARGPAAEEITLDHALHYGMGEGSPLARIYDLQGWVLLLGVGFSSCSSLHLSEYRADFPGKKELTHGAPVMVADQRTWVEQRDLDFHDDDFEEIGAAYQGSGGRTRTARVGYADALFIHQRPLVDFAVSWMEKNRQLQKLD